jgi:hypothetical protein
MQSTVKKPCPVCKEEGAGGGGKSEIRNWKQNSKSQNGRNIQNAAARDLSGL